MNWFRAGTIGKKDHDDIYGDMVRFAVDKFRDRDFAQAVNGFRNAAKLRPIDAHHEALMKRAVSRWKQSVGDNAPAVAEA